MRKMTGDIAEFANQGLNRGIALELSLKFNPFITLEQVDGVERSEFFDTFVDHE